MSFWIFKKDKSGKEKVYSTDITGSFIVLMILVGVLTTVVFTRISNRPQKVMATKILGSSIFSDTANDIRLVHCSSGEYDDFWIRGRMEKEDFSKLVRELQLVEEPNISTFPPTLLSGPTCDENFRWEDLSDPGESVFVDFSKEPSFIIARHRDGWSYIRKRMVRSDQR